MRRVLIPAVVVSVLLSALLVAQTAGVIRGIVRDVGGAALPGVGVTITSDTLKQHTTTDQRGEFVFRSLARGRYTVLVEMSGFKAVTIQHDVTARASAPLSIRLTVADVDWVSTKAAPAQPPPTPPAASPAGAPAAQGQSGGIVGGLEAAPGIMAGGGTGGGRWAGGGTGRSDAARAVGSRPGFNTEAYDKIDDNQWTEVRAKPLSTFSTDVDTASYANVRRFLNQGQLPPKDAVRIEELINYFSYHYAAPKNGQPFAVTTAIGDAPWNPRHKLALIGLQAKRLDTSNLPPRNLVFLVDVSGSMNTPQKLPLVKASLAMLARNLTARDRVAIVVYAGAAGLVLPSTSGADTTTVIAALGQLQAGGSTIGGLGITLAYDIALKHFIKGGVNRVVLATDGDFNVGVTSQGELIRMIEENRERGVSLSVLGFGIGNLKDSTMEKLADKGNGNYSYIDTLTEAQKVLVDDAHGTLVTVARDVKLQIEFNPHVVVAYRLIGYENRVLQDRDFNDDKKDAGDMGAGHSVTALYELVPVGEKIDIPGVDPLKYQQPAVLSPAGNTGEAFTVKLRYKAPDANDSSLISVPVLSRPGNAEMLGFPAAVAEFGMLLRGSEHKGSATWDSVQALATKFKGSDPHGHRAEFIWLIGIAESVSRLQAQAR